jgi:hypothetical protein
MHSDSNALLLDTPTISSRDANASVVPRSFGRARLTGPALVLTVTGWQPLRIPGRASGTPAARYGEITAAATRQQASYKAFLFELLSVECEERQARRRSRLVREANFPRTKRLADFDFDANPNVPAALIRTLAKGAWIKAGQPVCLIGASGTGKSHLLIGLGTAAAEAGYRVRYTTAAASPAGGSAISAVVGCKRCYRYGARHSHTTGGPHWR